MPIEKHLLRRAYALAEKNKVKDAFALLNAVVLDHPNHVEAWEFLLNISTRHKQQLEDVGKRIRDAEQISVHNKTEILAYHDYLVNRMKIREQAMKKRRENLLRIGGGLTGLALIAGLFLLPGEIQTIVVRVILSVLLVGIGYYGSNRLYSRRLTIPSPGMPTNTILPSFATNPKSPLPELKLKPVVETISLTPEIKTPTRRRTRKTEKQATSTGRAHRELEKTDLKSSTKAGNRRRSTLKIKRA